MKGWGSGESPLLEVSGLRTNFATKKGRVVAVDGIDFTLKRGEILGIAGESGCGKSVTSLSILRLLPDYAPDMFRPDSDERPELARPLRRPDVRSQGQRDSHDFQDPMTSLNPVLSLATQMIEPFVIHQGMTRAQGRGKAWKCLKKWAFPRRNNGWTNIPTSFRGACASG
jgi:ABC-type dipeptide/oligopeptide/nickel transport system ATPase component